MCIDSCPVLENAPGNSRNCQQNSYKLIAPKRVCVWKRNLLKYFVRMTGMFTFNLPNKIFKCIVRNDTGFAVWFSTSRMLEQNQMFINSLCHRANGTVLLTQQTEACVLWMIILFPMESAGCWLTVTMVMYLFGSR